MARQIPKQYRKAVKALRKQGWRIVETKDGWRCLAPDGETTTGFHASASDRRAFRNFVLACRRAGADLD